MKKTTFIFIFLMLCGSAARAAGPNLFTYQGRLKEGGLAVTGNRTVELFLCDAETGPTCTTTQAQPVAVTNGLFRSTFTVPAGLNLGSGNWWLEIKIGANTLAPREQLGSNAYALFAATAAYAENISAAPGSNGVYISSNLYVTGGGKFMGDGSGLSNLPAAALTGVLPAIDGSALTGVSAGVIADNAVSTAKIQAGAVTLLKLENVVDSTLLGNNAGAAGPPLALTAAQAKALLGLAAVDVGLGNVTNVAQLPASYLDTDNTLAADSDLKVPSQKAVKGYIDTGLSAKLAVNGDGSALTGLLHSAGDEAADGLKVFTSSLSVNNSMLLLGNYALLLSSNPGYGGGLRHDQSGNETLVMAVRNANSKIYLATAYDVSVNAGGGLSLPATPELTVYSGKVGINKPAPGYALDVSGQVNASAGLCIGGTCKASWTYIDNLGDHTATQALNLAGNQLVSVSSATLGGPLTLYGSSVTLKSAGATKFAVDTNGHVGVNAAADSASGVYIYGSGIYDAGLRLDYSGMAWAIHNNNGVLTFTKTDGATTPQLYLLRSGDLNVPNGALLVGSTLTVKNQLVGINNPTPAAALDVKSTGTLVNEYAQIWRNTDGTVVASITATGLFYGVTGSGDSLGNHTATQDLLMGANNISMTGTLGATGARLAKGWFTDLETTNAMVGDITGNAVTASNLTGLTATVANLNTVTGSLGTAAFTAVGDYATAAQGMKADNALPSAVFTDAAVNGKLLTGFASGAGMLAGTDSILQAINKLDGNDGLKASLSGINTFTSNTASAIKIKPDSAPAANTVLLDMQATGAGVTNFSVDSEGDTVANSFTGNLASVSDLSVSSSIAVGNGAGLTPGVAMLALNTYEEADIAPYSVGVGGISLVNPTTNHGAGEIALGGNFRAGVASGNTWNFPVLIGARATAWTQTSGIVSDARGVYVQNEQTAGTITQNYGVYIDVPNKTGGVVQNNTGLYVADQSPQGSVTAYNIYSAGATSKNYFEGTVSVGKFVYPVKTKAQLSAIVPLQIGEAYVCSDCSPTKIVFSTGTAAGNFADPSGGPFK